MPGKGSGSDPNCSFKSRSILNSMCSTFAIIKSILAFVCAPPVVYIKIRKTFSFVYFCFLISPANAKCPNRIVVIFDFRKSWFVSVASARDTADEFMCLPIVLNANAALSMAEANFAAVKFCFLCLSPYLCLYVCLRITYNVTSITVGNTTHDSSIQMPGILCDEISCRIDRWSKMINCILHLRTSN